MQDGGGFSKMASRSLVLSLFRKMLRYTEELPASKPQFQGARERVVSTFKERKSETDPVKINVFLKEAESKLSFLRMATHRGTRYKYMREESPSSETIKVFHYDEHGKLVEGHAPVRGIGSKHGHHSITEDDVRRHKALLDRQHFRGPFWAGKPKY